MHVRRIEIAGSSSLDKARTVIVKRRCYCVYFPKKLNFAKIMGKDVEFVVERLNNRVRNTLI